ncbi:TonB-dependent receptor [Psychrosphaera sp.]|nr:TonB-dependent receptor [Psychrosphaera sp.]
MFKLNKSLAAIAVTAALGMSSAAFAGNNDGSLKGLVVDSNKQTVAGATITIKNEKTGFTRSVVADENGKYRFSVLPVGTYTLTTTKDGFTTETYEDVSVRIGESSVTMSLFRQGVERISVTGRALSTIDTTSSESALNIGAVELARLPVARDLTSVALLAPGANLGDSAFGKLPSFGGASVAENAYFINGLNVTDFRNGLGGSTIPFEFYKEFEVKTGGYSAEFGRSTGGVINAVTKSGTNEFEFGANFFYEPESLRETNPDIRKRDGSIDVYNSADSFNKLEGNIYASGPIIEDTLFFYVLYNPRDVKSETISGAGHVYNSAENDDAFWGAKFDWNINDNHILELTAFSDKQKVITTRRDYSWNQAGTSAEVTGDVVGGFQDLGGRNIAVKYTGYITDDFTLSVLWGENEANKTVKSDFDSFPVIYDNREGNWVPQGSWANFQVSEAKDTREAFRIDGEYAGIEDHNIRFGFDREINTSLDETALSGGVYWALFTYDAGEQISGIGKTFDATTEVARRRDYSVGGEFETESTAFYVEDTWYVNDNVTATIGLRSESFNNKNAAGESFIKIDNQIAPRLGVSWDINGDGESKLFANYGRYHLPVAANTNIRMAGAETYIHTYYALEGINADFTPITGEEYGRDVNGDGTVPDVREVLDTSIDPMYQDEFIIGFETMLNDDWSFSTKYTHRDLGSVIDDITIDKAIGANGWAPASGNVYVLTNPNTDIETYYDTDGDGTPDPVSIKASDLGYPDPERLYDAIDVMFKRAWDDVWTLDFTYTWSRSRGNAEGYVKSDNGQSDAGLTTDWDFPYLMDGAEGYLPNDRRHSFKLYGAYALTENLSLGTNLTLVSGRPVSGFGHGLPADYGTEFDTYEYGQTYFLGADNSVFLPRGSFGRTPWVAKLDMNLTYNTKVSGADVTLQADVFNILNAQGITKFDEDQNDGAVNDDFLLPTLYQAPRSVRFSATVRF